MKKQTLIIGFYILGLIFFAQKISYKSFATNIEVPFRVLKKRTFITYLNINNIEPLFSYSTKEVFQVNLDTILKRCAEYCEKLSNLSLFFVCQESINEEISYTLPGFESSLGRNYLFLRSSPNKEVNDYVYNYQLVRNNKEITESRILLEENGKKKFEKDARLKLKTKFYYYEENLIFWPIGLFSKSRQQYYDYKIIKEEKYKGEKAIVMEVIPLSQVTSDNLYGKVWVNKDDFGILKIEWNLESTQDYKTTEAIVKYLDAKPRIIEIAEYAFKKNEVKFPSKYSFKESYILKRKRQIYNRTNLTIIYKDYEFFVVETEVKNKDIKM